MENNIKRINLTKQERSVVVLNAICKKGVKRARSSRYGIYEYTRKENFEVVVNIARGGIGSDYYFKTEQELRDTINNAEAEAVAEKEQMKEETFVNESKYQIFLNLAESIRKSVDSSLSLKQKRDFLTQKYPDINWSLRNTKYFLAGVKNMIFAFGKWRRI